ncbi:MAG TPA: NUDIX hydrolase [Salinimicrobium sp.]|nr:NUDIX hydrolase [Salinimicrobium sp.]
MEQRIAITVDCVIFKMAKEGSVVHILLVQRKKAPFKEDWALPGGFLEEQETMETGALRELREETGLRIKEIEQLKAFGAPGRDPRGRTITIAFWGETDSEQELKAADDASQASWFSEDRLPALGFDHSEILKFALLQYRKKS